MTTRLLSVALLVAVAGPLAAQAPAVGEALTLQEAIARGLERGNPARAARATLTAAEYQDRAFHSRRLPQLTLTGTPRYNRSIIAVVQPDGSTLFRPQEQTDATLRTTFSQKLPLTGGELSFSSSLSSLSLSGAQSRQNWNATPFSVGLRQDLLRPNALAWEGREQDARAEVAGRQFLEAREDISLQVANLYFDVYAQTVQVETATKNVAVNDTLFRLNKGRFEVAKIGENELLQSELALLRARTSLDGARLELERALAALRIGLNLPDGAPLELRVSEVVPLFATDTTRAVAEAVRNRAVVAENHLQDVSARRRVNQARFASWIGASIDANYGFNATGTEANLAYQNLLEARQVSVSVSVPLWQWGAHGEDVRAAKAEQERVNANVETARRQLEMDARFAVLQLEQARRTLAISAKADTVADKRFEVAYNRYVVGKIAITDLYQGQGEKDQARNQFVQALRGYWQAHYRLRRMTLYDFEKGEEIR